ncbi:sulfotransferase family protein [Kiritimatiella glycovorans]|nr:sulfotransferase [Kiritimatiella glycovorans]
MRTEKPVRSAREYLRNRSRGLRCDRPPVFIVGCGHSGTSLMLRIVDMHSSIYGVPFESRVLLRSRFKIRMAEALWRKNAVAAAKRRWAEKTPAHVYCIDRIFRIWPQARVILMRRDGRDVAVSLRERWGDFDRAVHRWIEDNRAGDAWCGDPRVFELRYEDLVRDFEPRMREVMTFLGERFEEGLADFHTQTTVYGGESAGIRKQPDLPPNRALRKAQLRNPLYDGSGRWRDEMSADEKCRFKERAGDLLIDLGYAGDLNW